VWSVQTAYSHHSGQKHRSWPQNEHGETSIFFFPLFRHHLSSFFRRFTVDATSAKQLSKSEATTKERSNKRKEKNTKKFGKKKNETKKSRRRRKEEKKEQLLRENIYKNKRLN
jgi:hypothetical protein